MKRLQICVAIAALTCLLGLAGCQKTTEEPAYSSGKDVSEPIQTAYESFLAGEISLFDENDQETWGLDSWKGIVLAGGDLEYTYLDLDGDGTAELLVQRIDDPGSLNGVFHYAGGRLFCWQLDWMEGSCQDYPLADGTMVRQYDFNGTRSYTLFRYRADGGTDGLSSLFVREELVPLDSGAPCPYYAIDECKTDQADFEK